VAEVCLLAGGVELTLYGVELALRYFVSDWVRLAVFLLLLFGVTAVLSATGTRSTRALNGRKQSVSENEEGKGWEESRSDRRVRAVIGSKKARRRVGGTIKAEYDLLTLSCLCLGCLREKRHVYK
jgi:hypothetical protein